MQHAEERTRRHDNEFVQDGQLVAAVLHALDQVDDQWLEQVYQRQDIVAVKVLIL